MKYISTRDPERKELGFNDVLMQGLAPDGGLYVPLLSDDDRAPSLEPEYVRYMSYEWLFATVNGLFAGDDITYAKQLEMAEHAYAMSNFPNRQHSTVTMLTKIGENLYVQDLSDGPTYAFKDMALQIVGRQMNHVLGLGHGVLDILGATSGDTGSAAGEAVLPNDSMSMFMLSPIKGPTEFQKAQMQIQSREGSNVHHIQMPLTFDECQDIVKRLKGIPGFENLGALNSINWGRVAAQVPYYFSGYMQAVADGGRYGDPVDFVVPTGNFGNVLAGYYARQLGLPIRNLCIATNENDVLVDLVNNGVYAVPEKSEVTTSPSMDISVSSNFERLVFEMFERDADRTAEYMSHVKPGQTVAFSEHGIASDALRKLGFSAGRSDASMRLDGIRQVHAETGGFVIDPHTADAVNIARKLRAKDPEVKIVCLATADPVKFEETIEEALGYIPERTDPRTVGLESRAQKLGRFVSLETAEQVAEYISTHRLDK